MTGQVEILVLRSGHADALMQLFEESSRDAASANFHPHPFDAEWAERICRYQEKGLCFGLLHDGAMVAYAALAHGREIARSSQIRLKGVSREHSGEASVRTAWIPLRFD